ncbi:MAG: hypothetical protein Sapg2KO_38760 [Saprospiraceae bacterium]
MKTYFLLFACLLINLAALAQKNLVSEPAKAQFVTSDIANFWKAFDAPKQSKKAYQAYIDQGSPGLKDFIPYRIESAKNLRKMVENRRADYAAIRDNSYQVATQVEQMRKAYQKLKTLYPKAVFPPAYFVIGAFNSGGTASENGIIMGVEMQTDINNLPYIVAHEMIHFNQNYPEGNYSLLNQSIMEGAADFIGEIISGKQINQAALEYGEAHEAALCQEFVEIMNGDKYNGWLYGSNGKKAGRPNDLGYWMGYKICKAYAAKKDDQKQVVHDVLNIQDFSKFLEESGYLAAYMD